MEWGAWSNCPARENQSKLGSPIWRAESASRCSTALEGLKASGTCEGRPQEGCSGIKARARPEEMECLAPLAGGPGDQLLKIRPHHR